MKTKGEQNRRIRETHGVAGELGDQTGTLSATLGYRLPHALLFVKWEIKGCGLNGLRARLRSGSQKGTKRTKYPTLHKTQSVGQQPNLRVMSERFTSEADAKWLKREVLISYPAATVRIEKTDESGPAK